MNKEEDKPRRKKWNDQLPQMSPFTNRLDMSRYIPFYQNEFGAGILSM